MIKNRLTKLIILIVIALFNLNFLLMPINAKAQEDFPPTDNDPDYEKFLEDYYFKNVGQPQEYNYYSYLSRKYLAEVVSSDARIPLIRKINIMDSLEADGYFALETKQEKKRYLRRHIKKEPYLSVVMQAEQKHNWTVGDVSQLSANASIEAKAVLPDLQTVRANYERWRQIKEYVDKRQVLKRCTTEPDVTPRGGMEDARQPMAIKSCWSRQDLDWYYYQMRTDFKAHQSQAKFNETEVKYLIRVNRVITDNGEAIPSGDEDLLIFWLPGPRTLRGAAAVLTPIALPASKAVVMGGSRAVGVLERKTVEEVGEHLMKVRGIIPETGEVIFEFMANLSRMFVRSSLTRASREEIAEGSAEALAKLSKDSIFGKYFTPAWIEAIYARTEYLSGEIFQKLFGKSRTPGVTTYDAAGNLSKIYLNEGQLFWMNSAKIGEYFDTYLQALFHEFIHGRGTSANYIRYYSEELGIQPLVEGTTELLTRIFMKKNGWKAAYSAYPAEEKVALYLYAKLVKKYGREKATEILLYLNSKGLQHLDDYLGIGTAEMIDCFMKNGEYDKAIKYIKSLNI